MNDQKPETRFQGMPQSLKTQIRSLRWFSRGSVWFLVFGLWSFALEAESFAQDSYAWRPLFNGRDLSGWKVNDFAGAA